MKLGSFVVEQLSEGHFEISPGGTIVKAKSGDSDEYSALVGIDPVVVMHGDTATLLDAGIGLGLDAKGRSERLSNLHTNLGVFGIRPEQVERVILSHLHYDHMAGLTLTDKDTSTVATLPNATIYVHAKEWEYALQNNGSGGVQGIGYELDDFYRLVADRRVRFLEDDYTKIAEGIEVIRTGGHTPGHMIVRLSSENKVGYYFGDLIPSELFLAAGVRGPDADPVESKGLRMFWLKQAYEEKAWVFFYHSLRQKYGRLERDRNRQFLVMGE